MPSKAKCKMMVGPGKKYKTMSECMSYGGKKMGKTQKPMASAKAEQDMVGTAMAKSKKKKSFPKFGTKKSSYS